MNVDNQNIPGAEGNEIQNPSTEQAVTDKVPSSTELPTGQSAENPGMAEPKQPESKWYDSYINSLDEAVREKEAGNFEKFFKDPADLAKSYRELQKKFSSGEHKKPLSENPSEEELAEYRKSHNIPDNFEGYKDEYKDGFIFGDDDKPVIDAFKEAMHKANAPSSVYKAAVDAYIDLQEKQAEAVAQKHKQMELDCANELKKQHGFDFSRHVNHVRSVLEKNLGESFSLFENAVAGDGNALLHHPQIFNGLLRMVKDIDPVPTITGQTSVENFISRKQEILNILKTDSDRYYREGLDKEYMKLLDQEGLLKSRGVKI